jgi:hypothetical protein
MLIFPDLCVPCAQKFEAWVRPAAARAYYQRDHQTPKPRNRNTLDVLRDRIMYYLMANPHASKNAIHKAVGGRREHVMDLVDLFRAGVLVPEQAALLAQAEAAATARVALAATKKVSLGADSTAIGTNLEYYSQIYKEPDNESSDPRPL